MKWTVIKTSRDKYHEKEDRKKVMSKEKNWMRLVSGVY
jgi:hypothetical protein